MVNQINKKRQSLTKVARVSKQAFKSSTKTTATHRVSHLNALISLSQLEQDHEDAKGKSVVLRRSKMGKNNALILPTEISGKKLKRMRTRAKNVSYSIIPIMYAIFKMKSSFDCRN
jgi:UTP-glucose-1-phosphate uridylyltransferase